METVQVKLVHPNAKLPTYATPQSACADIYAVEDSFVDAHGGRTLVKTGLTVAIPAGFEIQIRPRSGLALKSGVTVINTPGCIDADYRNEIGVVLINHSNFRFDIKAGERVAQMCLTPVNTIQWEQVNELDTTARKGGFGSTGK